MRLWKLLDHEPVLRTELHNAEQAGAPLVDVNFAPSESAQLASAPAGGHRQAQIDLP